MASFRILREVARQKPRPLLADAASPSGVRRDLVGRRGRAAGGGVAGSLLGQGVEDGVVDDYGVGAGDAPGARGVGLEVDELAAGHG